MIDFIVCCSQGMSSSALMKKMRDYISKENMDIEVKASTVDRIMSREVQFDVLLLGPQIRFEKTKLQQQFPEKAIDVIPMTLYGRLNGEEVVKLGLKLLNEKND